LSENFHLVQEKLKLPMKNYNVFIFIGKYHYQRILVIDKLTTNLLTNLVHR